MSVKKEADGRRSVRVETEVPGTPAEVWRAIATGPGVSSWFVPTEMEEVDGKPVAVKSTFGPGMESRAEMTAWDPPRRFAAESPGWTPEMPRMATEWTVEAKAGGTCIVRVVHSLFASTDDWDNQLEGTEHGWPGFFRTLRIYLTHFRGQRSAIMQQLATATGTEAEAWETLTAAMGRRNRRPRNTPLASVDAGALPDARATDCERMKLHRRAARRERAVLSCKITTRSRRSPSINLDSGDRRLRDAAAARSGWPSAAAPRRGEVPCRSDRGT